MKRDKGRSDGMRVNNEEIGYLCLNCVLVVEWICFISIFSSLRKARPEPWSISDQNETLLEWTFISEWFYLWKKRQIRKSHSRFTHTTRSWLPILKKTRKAQVSFLSEMRVLHVLYEMNVISRCDVYGVIVWCLSFHMLCWLSWLVSDWIT
jgi:hypothetical protein